LETFCYNVTFFPSQGISSGSVVAFSRVGGVHPSPVDRDQPVGANLELGELEQLTITNDNESSSYDVTIIFIFLAFEFTNLKIVSEVYLTRLYEFMYLASHTEIRFFPDYNS